jgi:hypothetical protein
MMNKAAAMTHFKELFWYLAGRSKVKPQAWNGTLQ